MSIDGTNLKIPTRRLIFRRRNIAGKAKQKSIFFKKLPDPWVLYNFLLILQNRNCHMYTCVHIYIYVYIYRDIHMCIYIYIYIYCFSYLCFSNYSTIPGSKKRDSLIYVLVNTRSATSAPAPSLLANSKISPPTP